MTLMTLLIMILKWMILFFTIFQQYQTKSSKKTASKKAEDIDEINSRILNASDFRKKSIILVLEDCLQFIYRALQENTLRDFCELCTSFDTVVHNLLFLKLR